MNRLPPDTRRTILIQKLRGASNREAAERTGVSKGTVANEISEARAGEVEPFERLDDQVDGLIELGKRLKDADLDLRTALIGLDVIELM